MNKPKAPVRGDWVRFQRDARLVIGVVEYVLEPDVGSSHWYKIVTSHGVIDEEDILELREAK